MKKICTQVDWKFLAMFPAHFPLLAVCSEWCTEKLSGDLHMKLWEVPAIYTHITYVGKTSQHFDTYQYVVTIVASFQGLPGTFSCFCYM